MLLLWRRSDIKVVEKMLVLVTYGTFLRAERSEETDDYCYFIRNHISGTDNPNLENGLYYTPDSLKSGIVFSLG